MPRKVVMASPKSGREIDALALKIIARYQPEVLAKPMPFDVERFFENELEPLTGVTPDYRQLSFGIHGYTDSDLMESVVSVVLAEDESRRHFFRATVAHEIGHAIQHVVEFRRRKDFLRFIHNQEQVTLRMFREDDIPLFRHPEWQAWRFAKALLMPTRTVMMALKSGATLQQIAEMFDVSVAFAKSRLKELGVKELKPSDVITIAYPA